MKQSQKWLPMPDKIIAPLQKVFPACLWFSLIQICIFHNPQPTDKLIMKMRNGASNQLHWLNIRNCFCFFNQKQLCERITNSFRLNFILKIIKFNACWNHLQKVLNLHLKGIPVVHLVFMNFLTLPISIHNSYGFL